MLEEPGCMRDAQMIIWNESNLNKIQIAAKWDQNKNRYFKGKITVHRMKINNHNGLSFPII